MPDIRDSIPEIDTTIDPSKFASEPGVAVADTYKSNVSRLEPPTDIDAATIGDYTPYEAVTGEVSDDATVEGRLSGLLSQDSDYISRAREEGKRFAARRGLLNSNFAAGAAEGAAIDRALPIAQQDAAAFLEQDFRNQGYSNDAARYLAEQSVQRENLQAGMEQDTRQFNQTNSLTNQRLNTEAENLSSREYSQAQNLAAANAAAEANRNNFAVLSASINAQLKAIDNQAAMNLEQLAREYAIQENIDTINGSIYQQLVAEIGTVIANSDKVAEATAKVNALIKSAGVEFSFTSGGSGGGATGTGGGGSGTISANTISSGDVKPPSPGKDYYWDEKSWSWKKKRSTADSRTCFTGDTLVRMEDGTEKCIADIVVGDKVLGMGNEINTVLKLERPIVGDRKVYSFNDGKPFVTAEHPFMTTKGWASISPSMTRNWHPHLRMQARLVIGSYIEQHGTSKLFEVKKLEMHDFDPQCPLYNFELSGNHTYFANDLLVHNKGGDGGPSGSVGGDGGDGGGTGPGGGCFALGTLFRMEDGGCMEIEKILIGDRLEAGGRVSSLIQGDGLLEDWFDYDGVHVTGGHPVWEDGKWIRVKDSRLAVPLPYKYDIYYSLSNDEHYMISEGGQRFTDYYETDLEDFEDELLQKVNSKPPPWLDRREPLRVVDGDS